MLQMWRPRGPRSGPPSLLCCRTVPHDGPLVWWCRGYPGVGRAGPHGSGPRGQQTHFLLLRVLLCARETTHFSLSQSVLWVTTANESRCVTARRSQAPGCEGARAPVIRVHRVPVNPSDLGGRGLTESPASPYELGELGSTISLLSLSFVV